MDQHLQKLRRNYAQDASELSARVLYTELFRCGLNEEALQLRASLGYLEEIKALPRPTKQQCRDFAEYAASAHSWYKHLDGVGEPFFFYLAPWAGRSMKGEEFLKESCWHYSDLPTKEHLERFGHWLYGRYQPPAIVHAECGIELSLPEEFQFSANWTRDIHGMKWPWPTGGQSKKPGLETPENMIPFLVSNRKRVAKGLHGLRAAWQAMDKFLETLERGK